MSGAILTLNAGSSSLKFALFDALLAPILRGEIEGIDRTPHLTAHDAMRSTLPDLHWSRTPATFGSILSDLLVMVRARAGPCGLASAGHRIVHGGMDHIGPARITPALMTALEALVPLDPLHLPHNLAPARALAGLLPDLPQVACFDTAFHHTIPPRAQTVPVPRAIRDLGVRRYGFHGLSYEYIAARLKLEAPMLARGRVIVAHLGAGASLCALHGGISLATTMGFSTLDGLIMATRCGSIDPGVILYLARQGHGVAEIEDMLYHRSGLLGLSGLSGDMRVLLDSQDADAVAAIDQFTYRIAVELAGMVSALGGIDGVVFTAGIGERSAPIRSAICARLTWLGLQIDAGANAAGKSCIAAPGSTVDIRVIATNEEAMIASHTRDVVARSSADQGNSGASSGTRGEA